MAIVGVIKEHNVPLLRVGHYTMGEQWGALIGDLNRKRRHVSLDVRLATIASEKADHPVGEGCFNKK